MFQNRLNQGVNKFRELELIVLSQLSKIELTVGLQVIDIRILKMVGALGLKGLLTKAFAGPFRLSHLPRLSAFGL